MVGWTEVDLGGKREESSAGGGAAVGKKEVLGLGAHLPVARERRCEERENCSLKVGE